MIEESIQLLIVEDDSDRGQATTQAKGKDKSHNSIDDNVLLVRFASLAIIFCPTVLAFDMREHVGPQRATPPCKTDFLRVALPTIRTRSVLSWVLHDASKVRKAGWHPAIYFSCALIFSAVSL